MPWARASSFSFGAPGRLIPDRSPFTSAANTGTPASDRAWARICRVTVLPVPVAPATRPWRLARSSRRVSGLSEKPTNRVPGSLAPSIHRLLEAAPAGYRRAPRFAKHAH